MSVVARGVLVAVKDCVDEFVVDDDDDDDCVVGFEAKVLVIVNSSNLFPVRS